MPGKKYIVDLASDEREALLGMTRKGQISARKMKRALILLKADEGWKDEEIVGAFNTGSATVGRIRKRFAEGGLGKALNEDPRPGPQVKLDEQVRAHLLAIARSEAPGGRDRWTLRLLADKLVELGVVASVSREAVRQALKRAN